jgi:Asp-tRNA(Asn)/Glu-tRNA(Gln) amidotransferase A subunit family amidase
VTDPNTLSATDTVRRVAAGETTAEDVVRACLARIEAREDAVHAWTFLDPDLALSQARALDRASVRGSLHGLPVGVKDIIDTADMPTQMGSPIYAGHRPPNDAACVAVLRTAGAVIMGKTVTCEFAGQAARETVNPHDPKRTPGGASSGSAAAVAEYMVPVAFGTQTGGSVLRPSSYCGIFGYKPTFGTFNVRGVFPAAQSLDTLGLHARTLDDLELLSAALVRRRPRLGVVQEGPPRVGLCRTYLWDHALPETSSAVEDAANRLADAGATVTEIALPDGFEGLTQVRETLNDYERAQVMAYEWARHRESLSPQMQKTIGRGLDMDYADYLAAHRLAEDCRTRLAAMFGDLDVLLTPAADGEAPEGLDFTGSPRFQGLWTVLHVPALTLPTHTGPSGLPVGIQLVGPYRRDDALMDAARWVWDRLGPSAAART